MPNTVDSQFVYPRSFTRDVARVLSDMRVRTWCDAQLVVLDDTIGALMEMFAANSDVGLLELERFAGQCRRYEGRAPNINHHSMGAIPGTERGSNA